MQVVCGSGAQQMAFSAISSAGSDWLARSIPVIHAWRTHRRVAMRAFNNRFVYSLGTF